MKKILITGGAGYIGSHAVKHFLEKGLAVVVFDNFSRGYREALEILKKIGDLSVVEGDLLNPSDLQKLFSQHEIESVLHFAAFCLVNESMEEPELYFRNNVIGSFNLFEAMRQNNVKNIVFSSTCAVYGESQYLPLDEKHPTNASNPYGESKLLTERILRWYGEIHDFHYTILRYFNVCGAASDGLIGDSKKPSQLLMQNAVRGALGIEPFAFTCPQVNTPDGTPIRDYIDVEDLVRAHALALDYLKQGGKNDTINLGNGSGYSVKQIVSKVEEITETTISKKEVEPRKGEYAAVYADIKKATDLLKWQPQKSLKDSVLSLKKWYQNFPNGYSH